MRKESVRLAREAAEVGLDAVGSDVVDVPSPAGRRRKAREIVRRLSSAPPAVWQDLPERRKEEQQVILYYCCMKTYPLIRDVHFGAVLPAWRSIEAAVHAHDIRRYLEKQSEHHPEINSWSEGTWSKVQQVLRKMLVEARLLSASGALRRVRLPAPFWRRFAAQGDVWFLEAMLMSKQEREEMLRQLKGASR